MAGFYYFFRGRTVEDLAHGEEINHNLLAEYGLAETLSDVRKANAAGGQAIVSNVGSNAGPGKSCGTVLTVNCRFTGSPRLIGNDPAQQHWVAANEEKGLWIGVLKGELPRPEELMRLETIGGYRVTDRQHYEWLIPVARAVPEKMPFGMLPQSYKFGSDGEPQPILDPKYQWLWDLSGEIMDWYRDSDAGQPRPHAWLVKTAAKLLGVNYRVGLAELNLLHDLGRSILNETTVGRICQACYGYEILEEAKKNSPEKEESQAQK